MSSRRRGFAVASALLVAAVATGGFLGLRALERAMTFRPERADAAGLGPLPAGARDVAFGTDDGLALHGWYWRSGARPAPPTVLYSHGNAGNVVRFAEGAARFAALGFDVLLYDYRGYGRSEGTSGSEATLNLDARAAHRFLTGELGVQPGAIALYGYSLGTTVSAELAVSGTCKAVILAAPLASASAQARDKMPWLPGFLHRLGVNRFDTVGKIARARCPVMVIHGDRDEVIDVAHGRAVHAAALDPKKLMIATGAGHVLARTIGLTHIDAAAAFIRSPGP